MRFYPVPTGPANTDAEGEVLDVMTKNLVYCVSCCADVQSITGAALPKLREIEQHYFLGTLGDRFLQLGEDALSSCLTQRDQPDAGRDEMTGYTMEVGCQCVS